MASDPVCMLALSAGDMLMMLLLSRGLRASWHATGSMSDRGETCMYSLYSWRCSTGRCTICAAGMAVQ
jgi:hypothetical protein